MGFNSRDGGIARQNRVHQAFWNFDPKRTHWEIKKASQLNRLPELFCPFPCEFCQTFGYGKFLTQVSAHFFLKGGGKDRQQLLVNRTADQEHFSDFRPMQFAELCL